MRDGRKCILMHITRTVGERRYAATKQRVERTINKVNSINTISQGARGQLSQHGGKGANVRRGGTAHKRSSGEGVAHARADKRGWGQHRHRRGENNGRERSIGVGGRGRGWRARSPKGSRGRRVNLREGKVGEAKGRGNKGQGKGRRAGLSHAGQVRKRDGEAKCGAGSHGGDGSKVT